MFDRNYDVVIPQKTDWSNRLIKVNYYAHVYFTDGSVKNESSGYGALYTRDHVIMRGQCGKYAKITQSEIIAIHTCCIHAINNKLNGQICIYSDSIGALNALKSPKINSELVLECVRLLEQLTHSCKVSLIWLPAHNGIYGNEVADRIAKYAATEIPLGPEPLIAIEQPLIRKLTNTWLDDQIKTAWRGSNGCEHSKCFIYETSGRVSDQIMDMSKNEIRIITGLITGHCKLNQHLVRMGIRNDPDCDLCGRTAETAKHILCECAVLANQRKKHFARSPTNPGSLCKDNLYKIIKFYKECSANTQHIQRAF